MTTDHRKQPRRRGAALNAAIYQATLQELTEVGYAALTMERVADRARTGKASLYRRWPTRMELALDAVYHTVVEPVAAPETGSLRGDLLAVLQHIAELLSGPAGEAMRGVLSDALSDRARTARLREQSQGAGRKAVHTIVERAVERGEIEPTAITPRRLEVGPAMLRQHFLFHGPPIPEDVVVDIVDEVLIPLFHSSA